MASRKRTNRRIQNKNILLEWYKNVEIISKRLEEVCEKTSKGKEIPSKNTTKNYKSDLVLYLNHQAQHKKLRIKITETQAVIIQTIMRDTINLITSSQKASSTITINPTKKDFIAKNHQLIILHIIKIAIIITK